MTRINDKFDVISLLLQPYTLDILHYLEKGSKRFTDIAKIMKNKKTLAIIGTKSLVKHDVKSYEIVAGIPAKHIRYRNKHKSNVK